MWTILGKLAEDLSFLTIKDNCCEFYTSSQFHTQELT